MRFPILAALAGLVALLTFNLFCAPPRAVEEESGEDAHAAYERFARAYLDWYYAENPVRATGLGLHDYDDELSDLTRAAIDRRIQVLHGWLGRLEAIDREALEGPAYFDHQILDYALRADLLELEEVRSWQRNPMTYNSLVAGAVASLADRDFAPLTVRMASMTARMRQVPALLETARANLEDVPPLWVELTARLTRGTAGFLQDDLPAALEAQGLASVDAAARQEWDQARQATIAEVEAFADWLENDLAPRADGDFRLGKDLFERKLKYEEHVDLSAEDLRAINEEAIASYQAWVAREAAKIDPDRPPGTVMDSITSIFPAPDDLIPTAQRFVEEARDFVKAKNIVTLPSDALPLVRPTPPYARSGFASMDTPGPFEENATEAYYNVTNVDPAWTPEQQTQHLSYFNYPGLLGISVHEVMPGHFVQLLYEQQIPTEVRKVFTPASLVEGWAHYAEQMMVDEGLGGGDPAVRLGQLRRALQRHARWHAGLSMHAFGETVEDAAARFEKIAYFAPFPALRETERGTYNPTYLYYALGRMQILKLREDYRRYKEARGEEFSLRAFHDTFLRLGLPVSLAREAMMPD